MGKLVKMDIGSFLREVASSSPAPGGGSVAALAGALSASLSSMVCNLTIGKEKYKEVEGEMRDILKRSTESISKLKELIDKDTEAFKEVMDALKLPKENEKQKEERKQKIQMALKKATMVPLETARLCFDLIEISKEVVEKGNKNSITDAGVSAIMAKAGFDSALLNVKINLSSITDEDFVNKVKEEIDGMEKSIEGKLEEILQKVNANL
ncbi:MAG: cyclodeaminase/cyclohydrolase family protein [Thermoplasmata archaeon]|nr:cyclodeaminase/cyclohydrolase family protein [Thermoplasmata archaeon]